MKTEIKWAELHSPIFLAGTNLQAKLDPDKREGLKLEFDEEKRHLYVSYKGETSRVPEPSILSMVEGSPKVRHLAAPPKGSIKAQVSTPQDHVFAGEGKGKSRA